MYFQVRSVPVNTSVFYIKADFYFLTQVEGVRVSRMG